MANKFDEKYEIRLACKDDIDAIMQFIDKYWSKGHIMATDRKLFEYEYLDGEDVNFVLAIDKETQYIEAILGFIKCSHSEDYNKMDLWGSMWKVNNTHKNIPFLGIELCRRILDLTGYKRYLGSGVNPKTAIPLMKKFFKKKVAKMKHYYILNTSIKNYQIAIINNKEIHISIQDTIQQLPIQFYSVKEVEKQFNIEKINQIPYKDNWYLNRRFFQHPYYTYQVYGLKDNNNEVKALLITRIVEGNHHKVLRIVDYIGDQSLLPYYINYFYKDMIKNNYEYIDLYTLGFKEKYLLRSGFKLKNEEDTNIIPNYFEPLLRENIDIWVQYADTETLFFKADADQDRPNSLPSEIN